MTSQTWIQEKSQEKKHRLGIQLTWCRRSLGHLGSIMSRYDAPSVPWTLRIIGQPHVHPRSLMRHDNDIITTSHDSYALYPGLMTSPYGLPCSFIMLYVVQY